MSTVSHADQQRETVHLKGHDTHHECTFTEHLGNQSFQVPYLNITPWSHKELIDLISAELPKDVLEEEITFKY